MVWGQSHIKKVWKTLFLGSDPSADKLPRSIPCFKPRFPHYTTAILGLDMGTSTDVQILPTCHRVIASVSHYIPIHGCFVV